MRPLIAVLCSCLALSGPAEARSSARARPRAKRAVRRLVQLEAATGFEVRDGKRAWGTPLAVARLAEVLTAHGRAFPEARPLIVHDFSRRRGGRLSPHATHRGGRDVDIRLPLVVETKNYVDATPRTLDLARTWDLIQRFYDTGDVQEILLDRRLQRALLGYARGRGVSATALSAILEHPGHRHRRPRPMVIHWKGHRDHMHVRFRFAVPRKRRPVT